MKIRIAGREIEAHPKMLFEKGEVNLHFEDLIEISLSDEDCRDIVNFYNGMRNLQKGFIH